MKALRLQALPDQRLTLTRLAESTDPGGCEIAVYLSTRSFRGTASARFDQKQWTAFLDQLERVRKGERRCAELDSKRAGLSLQICGQGEAGALVLTCNLRHPSHLGADTAIYATGSRFTVAEEALGAWLHD